jgi:DNA-binding beta-propeller fold protein YncE
MVKALAAILAAIALAGCASPATTVLRIDTERNGRKAEIAWPSPPEVPRYLYAGQLLGESNYVDENGKARSRAANVLRWIAGIEESNEAPQGLVRPQSGTLDAAGRILVTDASRQAVVVFDPKGGMQTWERAAGLTRFSTPVGIAAAPDGRVWVADADLGFVAALDRDGVPTGVVGRGLLKRPTGVAYDPAARTLYVADSHAHVVKAFSADGIHLRDIGRRGEGDGEFNYPTHLAFAAGSLYVADTMNSRVQVFAGGERHRLTLGARGLYVGNLVRPKGVGVDAQGNIYVVESYFDHLLVYDRDGRFLLAIGGLGKDVGEFYLPSGVWTDARGRVFVADMFNGRVVVFQFLGGDHD